MAKPKTQYVCRECGGTSLRWQGQCPHCSAWNTLGEARVEAPAANRFAALARRARCRRWPTSTRSSCRASTTGIDEFDRVLGGGLVRGRRGADRRRPGHRQVDAAAAGAGQHVDTPPRALRERRGVRGQVALRARRLGVDGKEVRLLAEIALERIQAIIERREAAWSRSSTRSRRCTERAAVGAGLGGPGARVRRPADAHGQAAGREPRVRSAT